MTVRVLLVGPYDPDCGEYTFLAPPLGVWRLAGVLRKAGHRADVFDPNCCDGSPEAAFQRCLLSEPWDVIGFSTTGMTLRFDLALAHQALRTLPDALRIGGGMEATFDPERSLRIGRFDLVVLGEGERPLLEICSRISEALPGCALGLRDIAGTAFLDADGGVTRLPQLALSQEELRDAIFQTPYESMPYERYWSRLEGAYQVGQLPVKAEREARLAEIRSVRLITLNYCPMRCTFCSSTNFLDAAQGGTTARIARLTAEECVAMLERIVAAHPGVRTVIFQDDIFVFPADRRILPLCDAIVAAKEAGELPRSLQFISTNRVDAMTEERLLAMRRAGFRVLGFGIESFSANVLREFNKEKIHPLIEKVLTTALSLGITPFLDIILTSPRECRIADLGESIRECYRWTRAGCEVGMYPYVIPFSGAAMSLDRSLRPHTVMVPRSIAGTSITFDQPAKIPPLDADLRHAILSVEESYEKSLRRVSDVTPHLPSRVRSLLWILSAIPILEEAGEAVPSDQEVLEELLTRIPGPRHEILAALLPPSERGEESLVGSGPRPVEAFLEGGAPGR